MQTETFKSICSFLQSNNLSSTLSCFISETQKRQLNRKGETNKGLVQSINKVKINLNDQEHTGIIRNLFQKADETVLRRLVSKLNIQAERLRNQNNQNGNGNGNGLKEMKFYKKLVVRETNRIKEQVNKRIKERIRNRELSFIEMDQCNNDSIISRPEQAILILEEDVDEYQDNDDIGYEVQDLGQNEFQQAAEQIAVSKNYPKRALLPNSTRFPLQYYQTKDSYKKDLPQNLTHHIKLPKHLKFPQIKDQFYPIQYDGTIYDLYNLKIVFDQNKVGFQQERTLDLTENKVIAGKYRVINILGSAQFSTAVRVEDIRTKQEFCMKVISNNKDYVDQSLDQIKLLLYININANVDEKCVLKCYDFFYYKEHLIILTQLLKTDLYKTYMEMNEPKYFTLGVVQAVARQILIAMEYIHSLHIIHSDLKPENILMKSISKKLIKVIDFGNSAFFHDYLTYYIQTRSYRAPQVIIGCPYDQKIDIWSVGCIVAQLFTGKMLFENQSVPALLAKHQGIVGPWPEWMLERGKNFQQFFTKNLVLYQTVFKQNNKEQIQCMRIFVPKKTNLQARLGTNDPEFIDFVKRLLIIDPSKRPSATEALKHPFLTKRYDN